MWRDDPDTRDALAVLGLTPAAGLGEAKRVFRRRALALHPDTSEASPQALSELARILRAIRHLERAAPQCIDIALTPEEARTGGTRTAVHRGISAVFRLPAGIADGDVVPAVGDAGLQARIRVSSPAMPAPVTDPAPRLVAFIDEFAAAAPAARFARWLRKARSAA